MFHQPMEAALKMINTCVYPAQMLPRPVEEDSVDQPEWQLVVSFFCKGMIEGVVLLLLLWLLIQVLFVQNLEVHLQILLAVGLAVFCYCLVLGCILCCRRKKKSVSSEDREAVYLCPQRAERVTVTLSPSLCTQPVKQQYEELDGDVLELPSSPSEDDLPALPFDSNRSAELSPGSSLSTRRLSSPAVPSSATKRSSHGRASLPSLTKLSLVSKSRRAAGRRSTVSGENFLYRESSQLAAGAAGASGQQGKPTPSQYGSNSLSIPSSSAPLLHFSLLFSARGSLVVNILGLSGTSRRRSGVFVRASLPPICPSPQQVASRRRSLSPDLHSQSFVLQVGSVDELRTCTLRLAVFSRDFSGLREAALGLVELPCEHLEWEPDSTTSYSRQLTPTKSKLKKSASSQEALGQRRSSVCAPQRALGQLFILLQYQSLANRIKVMVRKAENLAKLTRIPGAADHYVVINLRQEARVIGTKETKGASGPNPVWNAPFLFDLPPGDITQLPLALEFIVMQGRLYTKSSILGRVLIGGDASEAGQGHWKEMCSRGQTETARWHSIQSE